VQLGALPELIRAGETGWLFAPGDTEACASRLAELLSQPALISAAGAAAREHVAREYAFEKMIAAYRAILSADARNGC
jgi:glycosyltransferase involved in cell wall biosynthesis